MSIIHTPDDYESMTLAELAEEFKNLKAQHGELKEAAAKVWRKVDLLRFTYIVKKMEQLNIDNVKISGVGRIDIRDEASCKTLDKYGLMDWFREHDQADMIQEVVNASTLKAFIREQIRAGNEIPNSELIDFNTYQVATLTKS
jgi:hypothetical protein